MATVSVLIGISGTLALFAAPVMEYMTATAGQLYHPSAYVQAVLGEPATKTGGLTP